MSHCTRTLFLVAAGLLAVPEVLYVGAQTASSLNTQWPIAGQNLANTRDQPSETAINISNVSQLTVKWVFSTHGSVSATPTVAGNTVYFPDWAG
jgi:polyvinyl alcohol dehydrogenase (cytochrome)